MVDRGARPDPATEGLADDVRGADADGVEVVQQVLDVVGDLVRLGGFAGVAVAEHVDRVDVEFAVRDDVAGERFQVPTGAVQEHDGLGIRVARPQRPGGDAGGVDVFNAVGDGREFGPDAHKGSLVLMRWTWVLL